MRVVGSLDGYCSQKSIVTVDSGKWSGLDVGDIDTANDQDWKIARN